MSNGENLDNPYSGPIASEVLRIFGDMEFRPFEIGSGLFRALEGTTEACDANLMEMETITDGEKCRLLMLSIDSEGRGFSSQINYAYKSNQNSLKKVVISLPESDNPEMPADLADPFFGKTEEEKGEMLIRGFEALEDDMRLEHELGMNECGPDDWEDFVKKLRAFIPLGTATE